jgi:hypothetical protein
VRPGVIRSARAVSRQSYFSVSSRISPKRSPHTILRHQPPPLYMLSRCRLKPLAWPPCASKRSRACCPQAASCREVTTKDAGCVPSFPSIVDAPPTVACFGHQLDPPAPPRVSHQCGAPVRPLNWLSSTASDFLCSGLPLRHAPLSSSVAPWCSLATSMAFPASPSACLHEFPSADSPCCGALVSVVPRFSARLNWDPHLT